MSVYNKDNNVTSHTRSVITTNYMYIEDLGCCHASVFPIDPSSSEPSIPSSFFMPKKDLNF